MKHIYTSLFVLLLGWSAMAQTFVCSPSNSANVFAPFNTYTVQFINMVNQTSDTMTLGWDLLVNTLDESWDYSLCDYTACYTTLPQSSVMSPNYGSNSFLQITINPVNVAGSGILKFWVFDVNNTSSGDTVTFNVTAGAIGMEESIYTDFNMYPNPARDVLFFNKDVSSLSIYDVSGAILMNISKLGNSESLDISDLNSGIYMVKLISQSGDIIFRELLIE